LDETMEGARANTMRDGWIDGWTGKHIFHWLNHCPS
jgi:hypothetical protein